MAIAIQHGVDGVIISNHGGRQLDTTPATVDILREVVPVAKGRIQIAVDGGIRRGSDIFKAIALGADFVFAGRIAIWGLAVSFSESFTCLAIFLFSSIMFLINSISMMARMVLDWHLTCSSMSSNCVWAWLVALRFRT